MNSGWSSPSYSDLVIMSNTCRWVEFTKKSVAKRVANMLNGEQIGMRRNYDNYK